MEVNTEGVVLSMERIIDLVRTLRNDLIKELLDGDALEKYFSDQFDKPLSKIKSEFARRELKDLLVEPVDLVHYARLISQMREINTASIARENHHLFYYQIDEILKKYSY
jgi:hypothetical protein